LLCAGPKRIEDRLSTTLSSSVITLQSRLRKLSSTRDRARPLAEGNHHQLYELVNLFASRFLHSVSPVYWFLCYLFTT
jgi:hypothetical protein